MNALYRKSLIFTLFCGILALLSTAIQAAPLPPIELRVADTPSAEGQVDEATGVSIHPCFRTRYVTDATTSPAVKIRIQVSESENFGDVVWDSGFTNIPPTASGTLTAGLPYVGPALAPGATYFWRVALQDDQSVSGPFSEPRPFTLAEEYGSVDLRVTTGIGSEELQGNPVVVSNWPPSLSAEYGASDQPAVYANVEVSRTADFRRVIWFAENLPIGEVEPGQRTPPIGYVGEELKPGRAYYWRIQLLRYMDDDAPWSSATASFVHVVPDPTVPPPGGFARKSSSFGPAEYADADVVLGDFYGNGVPDAVSIAPNPERAHVMYPDVGTNAPGAPVSFGQGRSESTLAAAADFSLNGSDELVTVDELGLRMYGRNEIGDFELTNEFELAGFEAPVAIEVADVNWDGWLDVVVGYDAFVLQIFCSEGGFEYFEELDGFENSVTDVLCTDFVLKDELREIWVVSGGTLYLYRGLDWLPQQWDLEGAEKISLANQADLYLPEFVAAGPQVLVHCTVLVGGFELFEVDVDAVVEHSLNSHCIDVAGRELTGDESNDVVLLMQGAATVWKNYGDGTGYQLHEYVGHPGGEEESRIIVSDVNGDFFPDVVIARRGAPHGIYFNKPRISASIEGSQATQVQFGEAYVEFRVTLDTVPVSMVEVYCETFEEAPEGGDDSDGDGLPDVSDFLKAQVLPKPYVPTAYKITFVPGQTVAFFRVPLTSYYAAPSWTLLARFSTLVGAQPLVATAAASVFAMQPTSGSSGPHASSGMQRDWKIDGEVHDVVTTGTITYFGGDFEGAAWEAQGVAALNPNGERRLALPLTSGTVNTVVTAPDGSIYFGGTFTIDVSPTQQIKNIAKCEADGTLATYFDPNPNGRVNSIAFDSYGRVHFGGKFTELEKSPGRLHKNLAWVAANGAIYTGWYSSSVYGVTNSYSASNAEVLVLKIAPSGLSGGDYLLVGGKGFDQAVKAFTTYSLTIQYGTGNFVGFQLGGNHVLTKPSFGFGQVNAIEVDTSRTVGSYQSHPIIIGGSYQHGYYGLGIPSSTYLTVTNFSGTYWSPLSSPTPVTALKFDSHGHLWVGRGAFTGGTPPQAVDPIAAYKWVSQQANYVQQTTPASNISNGWIRGFADGGNEMLAVGDFSLFENGQLVASDMATFYSEDYHLGVRSTAFQGTTNASTIWAAAATQNSTGHTGYLVCGNFSKVLIKRDNLAAMDAQGHLLDWNPRANDVVKALATDGSKIFVGGHFTTVGGLPRSGVAAVTANTSASGPTNWIADVAGAQGVVNALSMYGSQLIIGGDFTTINGVGYHDVAAVETVPDPNPYALPAAWDVELTDGPTEYVSSLLVDGTVVFIGGNFEGSFAGQSGPNPVTRPGLLAVNAPTTGFVQLDSFDAGLPSGCAVHDVAATSNEIVFVGNFTSVGGLPRAGAACVSKLSPFSPTSFYPVSNGNFTCVEATSGGSIYLGGDFTTVTQYQPPAPSQTFTRRGVAVLDKGGIVQSWTADVLVGGTTESVHALRLENSSGIDRLWVGGDFSGTASTSQHNLTWYSGAWYITTTSLPAVDSAQPYSPYVQLQLSEPVPSVVWSIYSSAAPNLTIDPVFGVLGGFAPPILPGQPLLAPVRIEASYTDPVTLVTIVASRWFSITINPPPPPALVSLTSSSGLPNVEDVTEGDSIVHTPTVELDIEINQPFSVPVYVDVEYFDGSARNGYEYSPQATRVIFYPQGSTVPTSLPPGTIATNSLTTKLPVTIYGNKIPDAQHRLFTVRISSLTANVLADSTADEVVVDIADDDPINPAPEPAYVLSASVRENAVTPANPQGVVAEMPYIAWSFGSDNPSETQGWWQVQVSHDSNFSTLVFDSLQTQGATDFVQLGAIPDGLDCYARVRVWEASWTAGNPSSEWYTFAFHRNWTPSPTTLLAPSGIISTARPTLAWVIADDQDGDRQHFVVHVNEASGIGAIHSLDSRVTPYLFEYEVGIAPNSTWIQVSQSGVPPGVTNVRVQIPSTMALDPTPLTWDWWVDVADPFEVVPGTIVENIEVDPAYRIEGVYSDANGIPLEGRTLNLVLLPNHTPLTVSPSVTGLGGAFSFLVNTPLAPGEIIAVCLDPNAPDPNNGNIYLEHASAILRFPGGDMVAADGMFRKVQLVTGVCELDARGFSDFNLGDLAPPATPLSPVAGFPFSEPVAGTVQLTSSFSRLELNSKLRVRGTYAAAGEPTILSTVAGQPQLLVTNSTGTLSIEEGATADLQQLENNGSTSISGGTLALTVNSSTTGDLLLTGNGSLQLNNASLTHNGGNTTIHDGLVSGLGTTDALISNAGSLSIGDAQFINSVLEIGSSAQGPTVDGAIFTPGPGVNQCIIWHRAIAQPATMSNIRFDTGATYNVSADPGADVLTLEACGGDLGGENYDNDPAEASGSDIVNWEVKAITDLTAHSGDEMVLLTWTAGAQVGAGFTYQIAVSGVATGPFVQVGSTSDAFYIHGALTNDQSYFYRVTIVTASVQQPTSNIVGCTPHAPIIQHSAPEKLGPNSVSAATVVAVHTHFSATTIVNNTPTGVSIPSASVLALSESLLLYDIEATAAPMGSFTYNITTPDVWAALGAPGQNEQLIVSCEIEVLPTLDPPRVSFVQTGGALGPYDESSGSFSFAVEYETNGGAPIIANSIQCILNRDIFVGGLLVEAGTNLAYLWDTVGTAGASWTVNQVAANPSPDDEYVEPGELLCAVSIGNEYGYHSEWEYLTTYTEGGAAAQAKASASLRQGLSGQSVSITCNSLGQSDHVWFLNGTSLLQPSTQVSSDINVTSVTVDTHNSRLVVTADVSMLAALGTYRFLVGELANPPQQNGQGVWSNFSASGFYNVEFRNEDYTVLASGSPISMGTTGEVGPNAVSEAYGVILQNGEFRWDAVDMTVKGRAMDIVWDRHYRSSRANEVTPLGKGWFNTYTQSVTVIAGSSPPSVVWSTGTGELITFELSRVEALVCKYEGMPLLVPEDGVAAKAWASGPSSSPYSEITIQSSTGRFYVFGSAPTNVQGHNRLRLSRIEDTFANRVILEYVGQSLTGIRSDTHRKVASIVPGDTDYFGNRVAIDYDDNSLGRSVGLITTVSWGCDLVTITNPRQAVRYEYSADAQLVAQSVADGYISQQGSVNLAPTNRHGTQFNAYAYDQEQDSYLNPVGPALLKQVFSPSRAVLQNDPQDGNWKIVDQSQSGIQNLYVEYDGDDELRVVKQKLESGSERWVSITYPATTPTTTSRNVEWHSSVPSTTSKTVAYLLNNAGQPTSITINDHGSTCAYSYEYYDSQQPSLGSPQALKKVTFPKHNAITYEYGKAQDDPLARFESTKITQHAIPSSSLPPLETLREVVRFPVQDRWVYFNTVTRDPWGNTSSVLHEYYRDPSKPSDSPLHRIISSRSLSSATSIANNDNHTATTVMVLDGYGRTTSETTSGGGLMPQLKKVYNYYVGSSWTSYEGFLKNTTISTRTSDSGPDDVELKTSYLYDDYGRLQKFTPPENANGDHATIYHHNSAGQVFRIEYPKAGGSGTGGTRANVWYYYDKDGRVEREISSLDSSLDSSTAVTTADGSEDDNDIPNKFLRPSSLKGAGWVHTTHIYNAFGEPVVTNQDIDVGQQDVTVSSTAYDGYGRVISQEDATGRSIQYMYNDRDLVTKRIAAPGPFESVYAYSYDANGNVKTEGFVGDSEYYYTYDEHDRLDVTLSPAPGGWLAHQGSYPDPATTGGTQVTEDIVGFVQSVQGQVTASQQRIRWTEIDELGRPIRSAVLANDHLGQGLKDSVHVPFQTSLTGPLNVSISALQLDPYGNVHKSFSRMALPGGRVTGINKYNSAGWLLSSKSDDGHAAATYRYTKAGQPEHAGSPYFNGNQVLSGDTTYTYDPSGNLVVTQQEVGATSTSTTTYQLNDRGWAERVVDGSGRYSETEYNFVGWPRFSRVGQGSEFIQTETQYDSAGRVLVEKANRGTEVQETKYTYDPQGDLFSVDRPGTGLVEYYRDVAGRVWVEFRKQENVAIENVFDAAGNTVQRDVIDTPVFYSGMVFGPIREREKYSYSAFGETLTAETFKGVNEQTSKLEMKYNTLGLIEEQTLTVYQGGVPIDVSVDQPHSHTESELGFQSRYGNTHTAMVAWPMKATYDAEGRECTSTFWDDRAVKTSYEGQLLKKVQEYKPSENPTTTVEPTGMVLADYSYDEGLPIQRSHGNGTAFTFDQSPRGLLHAVTHLRSPNEHTFVGVKVRYDYSGNPAVEWRKHQGGLSRVMHYDHAGRLDESKRGHIPAPLPTNDEVTGYDTSSFQSHRKYTQDDVDNVTGYEDLLGATTKTTVTQTIGAASGNTIQSRTDAVGNFQYDSGNRISSDPTTKLKYEYNYRGQITSVSDGSKVLRTMAYDAFARMVLQVEVPGTNNERGTIFIPNIGFGGDGHGADTAGEVSYQFNGYHNDAIEVLQYSYGFGATGGGLGRKRTVEFVAYGGSDFKPYYRFLHEDTLGSTLATTDQFGDRHDEYDYTDYGVPLHAPVLLDGRHISSVAIHTSYPDVTKVNLSADILDTNELIGRELRVVKSSPTSPDDVYLTGTVISHVGTEVHIHDPGNAIFHAWTSCDRELTAVYDLHEGFTKGVIDSTSTGEWIQNGWSQTVGGQVVGEPCTFIRVDQAPFQAWMNTFKPNAASNPLYVTFTKGAETPKTVVVLGVNDSTQSNDAFYELVVQGNSLPSWIGQGAWYAIDGDPYKMNVAQSGKWKNATGGSSDTTFELHELSALTSNMVGWFLQPDINQQVYAPVTAVNPSAHTLTISGDYSSMGQTNKHWRLFAPSGVETYTEAAGTLSHWASAVDSRCLYAGYRYEAPLAGIWDWNSQTADYRQGGLNFAGQHYTLYRHYDPMLMRFTSPDPIASPSYNLFAYSGNTPAGAYDPDGLLPVGAGIDGQDYDWRSMPRSVPSGGRSAFGEAVGRIAEGASAFVSLPVEYVDHYANGALEPRLTQMYRQMGTAYETRQQLLEDAGDSGFVSHGSAVLLALGDVTGATGVAEYSTKTDSVTGAQLSEHEANVRGIVGGFGLATTALGGARVLSGLRNLRGRGTIGLIPKGGRALTLWKEYRYFKSQGYSPKASWRLSQPYSGIGHHYIFQKVFKGKRTWLRDSSFNVFKPRHMSTGRFYELHARLHGGASFGNKTAQGARLLNGEPWKASLSPNASPSFGKAGYLWHARPDILRVGPLPGARQLSGNLWWLSLTTNERE